MRFATMLMVLPAGAMISIPDEFANQNREDSGLSDIRLQKKVSVQVRFETVNDVLGRISRETGVTLTVQPRRLADRNMFLFANDRKASDLLRYLGKAVRGEWHRERDEKEEAFVLREMPSERHQLNRLRAKYIRIMEDGLESEVRAQQKVCALPLQEILSRTDALRTSIKADALTPHQKQEIELELRRLSVASARNSGPLLRLFAELPMASTTALFADECLRFSTHPRGSMKRMPGSIAQALIRSRPDEIAQSYTNSSDKVEIRGDFRVDLRSEQLALICRSQVLGPPHVASTGGTDATVTIIAVAPSPEKLERHRNSPEMLDDNRRASIAIKVKSPRIDDPSTFVAERLLVDYVDELARNNPELCLLGDASLTPLTIPLSLAGTLSEILAELCDAAPIAIERHATDFFIMRSRTDYIDEVTSIPADLLRNVMKSSIERRRLTILDHAELAARLTDPQIAGLRGMGRPRMFMWPPIGTQTLHLAKHHLRFLATLDSRQRETLLGGEVLPFARLGSHQRKAYVNALESGPGRPDQIEAFTTAEAAMGGVRLMMDSSDPSVTRGELVYLLDQSGLQALRVPFSLPTPNLNIMPRTEPTDSARN